MKARPNVREARPTFNPKLWQLRLTCGHLPLVTAQTRPTRRHHYCEDCRDARKAVR